MDGRMLGNGMDKTTMDMGNVIVYLDMLIKVILERGREMDLI